MNRTHFLHQSCDDQTLTEARPVFQKAYDDLKRTTAEIGQSSAFQAIREKIQSVNSEFKSGLETVLTEEQLAKLEKWQQPQQNRMRGGDRSSGGRNCGERRGGGRPDRSQN